jgi:hypothetical protein
MAAQRNDVMTRGSGAHRRRVVFWQGQDVGCSGEDKRLGGRDLLMVVLWEQPCIVAVGGLPIELDPFLVMTDLPSHMLSLPC